MCLFLGDMMLVLSSVSCLLAVTFFLSRTDLKGMWILCAFLLKEQQLIKQAVNLDVFVVGSHLGDMM